MAKLDTKKALELLEMTIEDAENLRADSYENGKNYIDDIEAKIKDIIEMSYDNADDRLTEHNIDGFAGSEAISASPEVLEANYQNRILKLLLRLHAMKEEFELLQSIETSGAKLDKIEADIEKAKLEAERRGFAVEDMFYSAFIEIIDRIRDELKGRTDNSKDIAEIKKEIAELRKVVMLNAEDLRNDTAQLQVNNQVENE